MNQKQAALTQMFLGTARKVRTRTGASDDDMVPALLATAHAIAMRGDPTWSYLADMFTDAEKRDEVSA